MQHLFRVIAATLQHPGQSRLRPEQALHPGQGTSGSGTYGGVVAPKTELAAVVGPHFLGDEGQFYDPARLSAVY